MNCFSEEEKKWIILEYGTSESSTVLRRKFFLKYGINGRQKEKYKLRYFGRENPYVIEESVTQGAEKLMCWAGVINGRRKIQRKSDQSEGRKSMASS